jgi:hypothetical protein
MTAESGVTAHSASSMRLTFGSATLPAPRSLCDGSLWLSLAIESHVHHDAARHWLDGPRKPEVYDAAR